MEEVQSYQMNHKQDVTPRVKKLFDEALEAVPSVCVERARYWTQSWKETEGEPLQVRRGKAIAKVLENMSIYIRDGELIVGNVARKPRASVLCPEYMGTIMAKEFNDPEKAPNVRPFDRHDLDFQTKTEFIEEIFPYWQDKTIEYFSMKELSKECVDATLPSESDFFAAPVAAEIHLRHGAGHLNPDYEKVLKYGARAVIDEARERMEKLAPDEDEKREFYEAVIISYEAFIKFAHRYADLATQMAEKENDAVRKQELLEIAKRCMWVPENPARTFVEAMQSFWFLQIIMFGIEQDDTAISPGRIDQYMYPFYKADKEAGILTDDEAQELIELMFIKSAHMSVMWDCVMSHYHAGFSLTQTITIGGVDENGLDATNELSYMFLEAEAQVPMFQPEFAARIHKDAPFEYFKKIAEVSKLGHGKPKMFVDETAIPAMLKRGATLEEARDYCIIGCVEPTTSKNTCGWTNAASVNLAKCMELALNEGKCLITGEQLGPKTKDPATFTSMNDVINAYHEQVAYFTKLMTDAVSCFIKYHGQYATNPFTSAIIGGCMEQGKDMIRGGAKYMAIGVNGVAAPDVGDVLAAIDMIVFQQKECTMAELADALRKNFEGYDDLRHKLLHNVPKYGNDNEFVDNYVRKAGQIYCKEVEQYTGPYGEQYWGGEFAVSSNVPHGLVTGALASGRKAKEPLANGGISATNGSDMNGPTAVIKSAAKVDSVTACNGTLLNMRFSPSVLKEERDIVKFANFIRAYCLAGGYHIQFNVVSSDLLKDAQKKPEKYKNLLVRVAGYSAYFTELNKEVQDDLIARTVYDQM